MPAVACADVDAALLRLFASRGDADSIRSLVRLRPQLRTHPLALSVDTRARAHDDDGSSSSSRKWRRSTEHVPVQ